MLESVHPAQISTLNEGSATLSTGRIIECDCVIACVGFERNTTVCEALTDKTSISHANYLAPNLIYLADAEIDEQAFNYFFGSSVIEYAKFYSELWGANVATCVEIKTLRRSAESSHRPPRHRCDACSTAWRCRFPTARPSQDGRVIAEK